MARTPHRAASTAPRAYWTGHLKLSLLSFPVRLYNVISSTARISLHMIDSKSGERIHYSKIANGKEVAADDIVRGFEYSKGRYVTLTAEDLEKVVLDTAQTMDIVQFVAAEELDPVFRDQSYYMAPDGDVADQAFRVVRTALEQSGKVAIVRVVFSNRERIAVVEPHGPGCLLTTLHYANEVKAADKFFDDIGASSLPDDELDLAKTLIAARTKSFAPEEYADRYQDALRELVEAKVKGVEPEAVKKPATAQIVNLMDALKRSVAEAGKTAKPGKKAAAVKTAEKPAARPKRKTA